MSFGLIGLHMKSALADKPFTISRNWLALGGAVSPESPSKYPAEDTEKKKALLIQFTRLLKGT